VARALDIAPSTLHRFVWKTPKKPAPLAASLRPVRVVDPVSDKLPELSSKRIDPVSDKLPESSSRHIVLHLGSDISVSGLDASELVLVLRGLR
jgi:hypothetical protein